MSEFDKIKGRVEKAVGELTDDEKKKARGDFDKAKGEAKEKLDRLAEAEKKPDDVKR